MTASVPVKLLAGALAAHIARTGQSIETLADELGVSTETVSSWLAGRKPMEDDDEFAHLDTAARFGAWLRARIADSGCSVRQIAETTEAVSMGTIYNWMRGEHLPPPPTGDEPDRFDLLLSNPALALNLRQRLHLDEVRRRLTGTSLQTAEPAIDWPARALPAANRSFTGRSNERRRLDRLLRDHARHRAVVISTLTGMGGAGKTALAVYWARTEQVKATFPDGCLFVDLNGYAETPPMAADAALRKLLHQLGIAPQRMPADTDALAAFYQETLTGRRLLVMLDNAHSEPQVRPLLPTDPACLAVVTSRNRLHGLNVTDGGISHLGLEGLTARESVSLLRRLIGTSAIKTASDADVSVLAEACAHLPLALQIAAANYLTHVHSQDVPLLEYAADLSGRRLDALAIGPSDPTTAVAAALDDSYRHLTDEGRRAYRLLGLHLGPDCSVEAVASLTAHPIDKARALLAELAQASLLTEHRPGRYVCHDLIRDHAAALADRLDTEAERREAVHRMLNHYVHTAYAANVLVYPGSHEIAIPLSDPGPEVAPESFADREAAMSWFEAEHSAMTAAAAQAVGEFDVHVWQLAWTLHHFCALRGYLHELIEVQHAALAAAQRLSDAAAQAYSHRVLAWSDTRLGRFEESRSRFARALELSASAGDLAGQAAAHRNLSHLAQREGNLVEALDHARRALPLYRKAGDRFGEARASNSIGWYHAQLGEYSKGRDWCRQALDLCRELGYASLEANVLDSLGYIYQGLGDHSQALTHYERARERYRELGERFFEADTLSHLGDLHRTAGHVDAAREAWKEAVDILTELEYADADHVRARLAGLDADSPEGD